MSAEKLSVTPSLFIVDDEPDIIRLTSRLLDIVFKQSNVVIEVVGVSSAEDALRLLSDESDNLLPHGAIVDGLYGECWSVIDRMAELELPVLLRSGDGELVEQARKRGIPANLKGSDITHFIEDIQSVFSFANPQL